MVKQLAIVIGLEYPGSANGLDGCYNDANLIEETIKEVYQFKSNEIISIRDNENKRGIYNGSKQNIIAQFNKATELDLEFLFIYVASHGIQTNDYNNDENKLVEKNKKKFNYYNTGKSINKLDSAIVTSEKFGTSKLLDDEIRALFKIFSSKTTIMAVFDCCHSGTICDVNFINILNKKNKRNIDEDIDDSDLNNLIRKTNRFEFIPTKYKQDELDANVIVISAARDKQFSYELPKGGQIHGHFTYTLCNIFTSIELEKISLGKIVILIGMKLNNKKQIPVLSSSKPIDVYNTFIFKPPFKMEHTEIKFYTEGSNENPPKNKGFLSALLDLLSRNEDEDIKQYFNINNANMGRHLVVTGIAIIFLAVIGILYYLALI